MNRLIAILVLSLGISAVACAQPPNYPRNITLTWQNPSLYTDDTMILAGDLDYTMIHCSHIQSGTVVVDYVHVPIQNGPGGTDTFTFTGVIPQPGEYACVAFSVTIDGVSSDASNTASKKYTGQPRPPVFISFGE